MAEITLTDLEGLASDLLEILAIADETLTDAVIPPGGRCDLDRATALLAVGRRLAQQLHADVCGMEEQAAKAT